MSGRPGSIAWPVSPRGPPHWIELRSNRHCCGVGVAVPFAGMTRIRFEGFISGRVATPRLVCRLQFPPLERSRSSAGLSTHRIRGLGRNRKTWIS